MAGFIILNYDYAYVENIVRFNVFGVLTYCIRLSAIRNDNTPLMEFGFDFL